MADVTIDAAVFGAHQRFPTRGGPFWTTTLIGYIVYLDSTGDLVWSKTADGGATWSGANVIVPTGVRNYSCWADWQTEGDAGTKIHIVAVESAGDTISYTYLDTSDDSEGGLDTIEACQGTGTLGTGTNRDEVQAFITKTRGGNIAVAFRYKDSFGTTFYGFYTSPDGDTWTSKASPWEAAADYILLFPANLADNQDLWLVFWDISANEISLKTYDDSGNDWTTIAEVSISGSMFDNAGYQQFAGAIRLSDGHLILAAWSQFDNAASDLMCWDITDAGTITAKTNLITNTAEYAVASVFINQDNDDIYVAYVGGTTMGSATQVRYKKSADGGGSWGGDTVFQADAEDDETWVSCGAVKAAWGGKFQPIWFNDDLNDLFTNTDNGISIAAAAAGETHEGAATLTGVGTLAGIGRGIFIGKATLSGTGTLAAIGQRICYGVAALSGVGTLVANGVRILGGKVTLTGVGSLSVSIIKYIRSHFQAELYVSPPPREIYFTDIEEEIVFE